MNIIIWECEKNLKFELQYRNFHLLRSGFPTPTKTRVGFLQVKKTRPGFQVQVDHFVEKDSGGFPPRQTNFKLTMLEGLRDCDFSIYETSPKIFTYKLC